MIVFKKNLPHLNICDYRIKDAFISWFEKEEFDEKLLKELFVQIGCPINSKLSLNNYDEVENSFIVTSDNSSLKVILKNGTVYNPEIIVENDYLIIDYEYVVFDRKLFLINCLMKNSNIKDIYFSVSPDGLFIEMQFDSYYLLLNLKDQLSIDYENYNIKNQGILFNMLSKLEIPISILDLFKNICDISFSNSTSIPLLSIELFRDVDINKSERIEYIEVVDSRIKKIYVNGNSTLNYVLSLDLSKDMKKFLSQFNVPANVKTLKKTKI